MIYFQFTLFVWFLTIQNWLQVQIKTSGQSFFDCPEVSFLPFCDGIRGRGHFAAGPDRFRFGVRRTMRVQKEVSIKFTGD